MGKIESAPYPGVLLAWLPHRTTGLENRGDRGAPLNAFVSPNPFNRTIVSISRLCSYNSIVRLEDNEEIFRRRGINRVKGGRKEIWNKKCEGRDLLERKMLHGAKNRDT